MTTRQVGLIFTCDSRRDPLFAATWLAACSLSCLTLLSISLIFAATADAQITTNVSQTDAFDTAPPPMKLLSKDEKTSLESESRPKERTSLTLSLMEARLKTAEKNCTGEDYKGMYDELGGFQALLDNNLDFLLRSSSASNKAIASLKKFEISLHGFAPRIEILRREAPSSHESYLRGLLKHLSDARERALEPLFGDAGEPRN